MFYVLQVAPGTEDRTEALIRGRVERGVYGRCFHLLRHVRKKFRGEWKDMHEKLLPGYVFVTSDSAGEFYQELKRVPMLTKLLGRDGELFAALRDEEAEWLEGLLKESSPEQSEVGLSQILAQEDRVTVLSGPLKSMEGRVKKYNLHKRVAEVEVEFMGRKTTIYLGVEMVGKMG